MAKDTGHFKEEIQELLDGRLDAQTRLEVERHLGACEECRREMEAISWTKRLTTRYGAADPAPAELRASVLRALDREESATKESPVIIRSWLRSRGPLLALAAVLLVAILLPLYHSLRRSDLPTAVAADYTNYKAGTLRLDLKTGNVKAMQEFFSAKGIPFETRVFDLGMMNYRLVGGRVHRLSGRQSAFFVYRGNKGEILVCQMYRGHTTELPSPAALRENKGIKFHIFRSNGVTTAFWQEGDVTCVLSSDIEPEKLVQLAFAKAMKI